MILSPKRDFIIHIPNDSKAKIVQRIIYNIERIYIFNII